MATPANSDKLPVILLEQLSYLMQHYGEHTGILPERCPECSRFKQVEKLLLTPFEVREYKIQRKTSKSKRTVRAA